MAVNEKRAAQCKAWRERNKDKVKAYKDKYHAEHREEERAYARRYHFEHRERELELMRKRRKTAKGVEDRERYRAEHYSKTNRAPIIVMNAISSGKLIKEPCEICGEKAEAHHDDYNYPLKVRWLCRKHHAEWHRFNKPIYYGES